MINYSMNNKADCPEDLRDNAKMKADYIYNESNMMLKCNLKDIPSNIPLNRENDIVNNINGYYDLAKTLSLYFDTKNLIDEINDFNLFSEFNLQLKQSLTENIGVDYTAKINITYTENGYITSNTGESAVITVPNDSDYIILADYQQSSKLVNGDNVEYMSINITNSIGNEDNENEHEITGPRINITNFRFSNIVTLPAGEYTLTGKWVEDSLRVYDKPSMVTEDKNVISNNSYPETEYKTVNYINLNDLTTRINEVVIR